jgi:hypothetical protein
MAQGRGALRYVSFELLDPRQRCRDQFRCRPAEPCRAQRTVAACIAAAAQVRGCVPRPQATGGSPQR